MFGKSCSKDLYIYQLKMQFKMIFEILITFNIIISNESKRKKNHEVTMFENN